VIRTGANAVPFLHNALCQLQHRPALYNPTQNLQHPYRAVGTTTLHQQRKNQKLKRSVAGRIYTASARKLLNYFLSPEISDGRNFSENLPLIVPRFWPPDVMMTYVGTDSRVRLGASLYMNNNSTENYIQTAMQHSSVPACRVAHPWH
jgi:hypothetical protein